ncbi:hypothetical protein GCM10010468_70820 [Actinocorallia longicatena]|uniref:Uncharacterized protein n=1 Tax=Actinocorallia longicatena TaxID=111803 RepID=A0ABP6QJV0_9ACTN
MNIELNSGAFAGRAEARCAVARGACSCSSRAASWACIASTAARAPSRVPIRTGSVLKNGPRTWSAFSPAFIRPNSTVPNTTSSRPDSAPSTRAHTTCITVAGLTPSDRATLRRPVSTCSGRGSVSDTTPEPSPRTSTRPYGAVVSVTSPSRPVKYRSCSASGAPPRT